MKQKKNLLTIAIFICMTTIAAAQTEWTSSGSNVYLVTPTNNVGIGTTSPTTSLDVVSNGQPAITVRTGGGPFTSYPSLIIDRKNSTQKTILEFRTNGIGNWKLGCPLGNNAFNISDANGNSVFYIDPSTNNVGIGISGASASLHVASKLAGDGILIDGTQPYCTFKETAGIGAGLNWRDVGNVSKGYFYYNYGANQIKLSNDASGSRNDFIVNSSGNVGIGTATPGTKLQIEGNEYINYQTNNSGSLGITALNATCNNTGNAATTAGYFDATGTGGAVYGVKTNAHGTGTNYGVYGNAISASGNSAYGLYGYASGPGTNWAGFFKGNVRLEGTSGYIGFYNSTNVYVGYIQNSNKSLVIGLDASNTTGSIKFNTNIGQAMIINPSNNIGMGTSAIPAGYKLAVNGKIICTELQVQLKSAWPDYVFSKDHILIPLDELEKQIDQDKHLKGIPSACEVKENGGIAVGEMQTKLLEKVEELTLYVIQLKKENDELKKKDDEILNLIKK
ncbi:MAG: hypothetical protein ABI723_07935 [Bacteroidia bacterium]